MIFKVSLSWGCRGGGGADRIIMCKGILDEVMFDPIFSRTSHRIWLDCVYVCIRTSSILFSEQ